MIVRLLGALTAMLGAAGVLLALAGYAPVRALLNPLAPDGSLEWLTVARYNWLRPALAGAGFLLAGLGWVTGWHRGWLRVGWDQMRGAVAALRRDFRPAWQERGEWRALLALTGLAAVLRLFFLDQPLGHDEAYTYIGFARRSLAAVISDYHLPNNHVFHTLLAHFSTRLLGDAPWALRLPAFVAGVLTIPAGYALGRLWFNRRAGWLAGGLLAAMPLLVGGSADARGYTLLVLISLLCWLLGSYLKTHPLPAGWVLLGLLGGLGFYTVPVMLYPLGSLYAWLFVSIWFEPETEQAHRGRARYLLALTASGLWCGALAYLLYLPVLLVSGSAALFDNPFVQPVPWLEFPATLASRLGETWREWQMDLHPLLTAWAVAGVGLSIALHSRASRSRVPVLLTTGAWMALVLLAQRPNAWRKTWIWLLVLLLVLAAAGWAALLDALRKKYAWKPELPARIARSGLICLALLALPWAAQRGLALAQPGSAEQSAAFIAARMDADGIVLADGMDAPPIWYYLLRSGGSPAWFERLTEREAYSQAYVIVDGSNPAQSLASVIASPGEMRRPLDAQTCRWVAEIQPYLIYRCAPR
ncbi:MAG: glycosyltransferase family 39 protein [Bellilinea sp.]